MSSSYETKVLPEDVPQQSDVCTQFAASVRSQYVCKKEYDDYWRSPGIYSVDLLIKKTNKFAL